MTRAGFPTATLNDGISPHTTDPAPITTCSPIDEPGSTIVPWPSHDPAPTTTGRGGANCSPIERRTSS